MNLNELKILYGRARFIRAFELEIAAAHDRGAVPGLVHLANGAEVLQVGVTAALEGPRDQVTGSHRSHGLALAMGVDPLALALEILGRTGGLSDGLGGTQHLLAPGDGFLTSNGIVGGQVPLAAGAALSAKTLKTGGIAVAFFGDGAINQGAVLETLNLANVLGLPLLFVIENNGLGQSTGVNYAAGGTLVGRARGLGLAAEKIDGSDISAVLTTTDRLTGWVRKSSNPAVLVADVPRLGGHYHGDKQVYRSVGVVTDPLDGFRSMLELGGEDARELDDLEARMAAKAAGIVRQAEAAPDGSADALARWQAAGGA